MEKVLGSNNISAMQASMGKATAVNSNNVLAEQASMGERSEVLERNATAVVYQCCMCYFEQAIFTPICTSCSALRSFKLVPRVEGPGRLSEIPIRRKLNNHNHNLQSDHPDDEDDDYEDDDDDDDEEEEEIRSVSASKIEDIEIERISTGVSGLDEILGSKKRPGAVRGTVVCIAGKPGAGKSTLIISAAHRMAKSGEKVLYVSGEEPMTRIRKRAIAGGAKNPKFQLMPSASIEQIFNESDRIGASVLFIDSASVIMSKRHEGEHHDQLVRIANRCYKMAQKTNSMVFLLGHSTSKGTMAGSTRAKHWVDALFWMEKDEDDSSQVILSCLGKNRFGDTTAKTSLKMITSKIDPDFGRFEE